jgi:hypothetical protein
LFFSFAGNTPSTHPPKKQKPYPKGKAKKTGIDFPQQYGFSLPISLGRLKDVLII